MDKRQTFNRVTDRIIERSRASRADYLERSANNKPSGNERTMHGCANLAHGIAACGEADKLRLMKEGAANLGIITAYNDVLSAHQSYGHYPDFIKKLAREAGGVAQVAGGVPAMCDGVTQGTSAMEISLMSREVIAMSTIIGLSHGLFDAGLYLGVCDKIVPGLVIGALSFGYMPAMFIPAGPMPSGISNAEKAKTRQLYAEGKVGKEALLKSEMAAYHATGTCTFYGTANSNQMLMEIMGLHMPGSSFVNPETPFRDALTAEAVLRSLTIALGQSDYTPISAILSEKAFVNGIAGLLATGGSTNHTMHLIAMAKTAGIQLTWQDFSDLSEIIPLLTRVYPSGPADVNRFQENGAMGYVIGQLLDAGLLHEDVTTVFGQGMKDYACRTYFNDDGQIERTEIEKNVDKTIVATCAEPFQISGGLKVMQGNLGQAISKVSAVAPDKHVIRAPARVFDSQEAVLEAFQKGELDRDVVVVVRFLGPKACGMPEAHKLTPALSVLQDRGFKVALVTDGRMSGASGKVLNAIHVVPEALDGGPIARVEDGDVIEVNAAEGRLSLEVSEDVLSKRKPAVSPLPTHQTGVGREIFEVLRQNLAPATEGASFNNLG